MCEIALGSDTGGSTRIPAALCGIVGWKPSKSRISTQGAFALSKTLDFIGPMARSTQQCADTDAVLAGDAPRRLKPLDLKGLRLGIAEGPAAAHSRRDGHCWVEQGARRFDKAGVRSTHQTLPLLDDMARVTAKGGLVPAEGIRAHRALFDRSSREIDPNVAFRFERAKAISDEDYAWMLAERSRLVKAMDAVLASLDALIMPTTPIVAPTIAEVAVPEVFSRKNALLLSNTSIGNFFDLCSISLPLPRQGGLPVGLMLMAKNGNDRRLFAAALALERLLGA